MVLSKIDSGVPHLVYARNCAWKEVWKSWSETGKTVEKEGRLLSKLLCCLFVDSWFLDFSACQMRCPDLLNLLTRWSWFCLKIDSGVPHWCTPGTVHERNVKELIWNWKDCWKVQIAIAVSPGWKNACHHNDRDLSALEFHEHKTSKSFRSVSTVV